MKKKKMKVNEYTQPWDDEIYMEAYSQIWSIDGFAEHPLSETKSRVLDLTGIEFAEQ